MSQNLLHSRAWKPILSARGTRLAIVTRGPALLGSQLMVALTGLVTTRLVTPEVKGEFTACMVWASAAFVLSALSAPAAVVMRSVDGVPAVLSFRAQISVTVGSLTAGIVTAILLWYIGAVQGILPI